MPDSDTPVHQALRATAAFGLTTTRDISWPTLHNIDWHRYLREVQRNRLSGLCSASFANGDLAPPEEAAASVADADESWQRHGLHMERILLDTIEVLETAGIRPVVFKGPALAHTVFPNPSWRVFGDIDLLLRADEIAEGRAVLVAELGAHDVFPEVKPGFDAEFRKDILIRLDGIEIDIHRSLAEGPFGARIPVGELFSDPDTFVVGGRELCTLPPRLTFLQVCYNAALGDVPPRLMSLRDVAQTATVHGLEPHDVLPTAQRWGGSAVVAYALDTAWTTLDLAPTALSSWAHDYRPNRLDRWYFNASTAGARRGYTAQVAAFVAIHGLRAKARYLRGILFPSEEYLQARGWTRWSHVTRAWNKLKPWA